MHYLRRAIAWIGYVGFLSAVGVVVFGFARHQPRCTITGPLLHMHLSADGARLVTLGPSKDHRWRGPLQVWDTHSGRVVHEWFRDSRVQRFTHCPDDCHGAVVLDDGKLRIVDWHTGREWRFDEPPQDEAVNRTEFSPGGRYLFVVTASCKTLYVINVNTCEVVLRMTDNWPRISADDRLLFYREYPDRNITVWDIQHGKALGVIPMTANTFDVSADGRLLLERPTEPIPAPPAEPDEGKGVRIGKGTRKVERKDYRVVVWDVATGQRRFQHELKRAGDLQAVLSPDSRFLAMWLGDQMQKSNLELIDVATGQLLWSYAMAMHLRDHCQFSPDGAFCCLERELDEKNSLVTMFDAATGCTLWEKPASGWGITYFAGKTGIVLHQEDFSKPLFFLDSQTGEQRATAPSNFRTANCIPVLTPDGRHFVIGGWHVRNRDPYFWEKWLEKRWPDLFGDELDGALVMESATGRELFRVVNGGKQGYFLSEDANTLVTVDPVDAATKTVAIRIWDVHPHRAWTWALGSVGALAALCFAASRAIRKLRRRKKTAGAQPCRSS